MRSNLSRRFSLLALIAILAFAVGPAAGVSLAGEGHQHEDDEEAAVQEAAPEPQAAAPAEPVQPPPEPTRISGKIHKVDLEDKVITVLVAPERGRSGRAFTRYKLLIDDNSLVLVNQEPSKIDALESGQLVEIGFFGRGKEKVIDTVRVLGKE